MKCALAGDFCPLADWPTVPDPSPIRRGFGGCAGSGCWYGADPYARIWPADGDGLWVQVPGYREAMKRFPRITLDPAMMGGRPCIRGLRITVATVLRLLAAGRGRDEILKEYPYLEAEDLAEALAFAAWLAESPEEALAAQ